MATTLNMASLELTTWRPTPIKPDLVGGSSTSSTNNDFISDESFKTMFLVNPTQDNESALLQSPKRGDSAFEGSMSHRLAAGAGANGAQHNVEFKYKITTSLMTEAALSFTLTLWRPTPIKPDNANVGGEAMGTYNGYFVFGQARDGCDVELTPCVVNNCEFSARLTQLAYSATARILELTIMAKQK